MLPWLFRNTPAEIRPHEPLPPHPGGPMNSKHLWSAVALLAAATIGTAAWKAWPLLHPPVAASAPLDPGCNLNHGPCTSSLPGGGRVTFAIAPTPIQPMRQLTLSAVLEGRAVEAVEADFQGVEMNMGFNRTALQGTAGRFEGGILLPVCVLDAMEWEARLLMRTADGLIDAPFRFVASR
ncbi:hypothetical protein [Endothiovibrio diazotrophicus]